MIKEPVDVLMPVRLGRFLGPAMESLLAQSFPRFRLVVVEDGADEETRQSLERYAAADSRILLVGSSGNRGLAAALNHGLAHCTSDLVARADADDVYHRDRLAKQVAVFRNRPELGVLSCGFHLIDEAGRRTGTHRPVHGPDIIRLRTLFGNSLLHPGTMFRRTVVQEHGGYDERFWTAQDTELWGRIAERSQLDNIPEPLVSWRRHGTSVVATRGVAGDTLSMEIPLRRQSAYLGAPQRPEDARAAAMTWRSFVPLTEEELSRGEGQLVRVLSAAEMREPAPVVADLRSVVARALVRQARWRWKDPSGARRLLRRAAAWRLGEPAKNFEGSPGCEAVAFN